MYQSCAEVPLVGCKVTGDPNVPANHWSFVAQVTVVPAMSCCLLLVLHTHAAAVPVMFRRVKSDFFSLGLFLTIILSHAVLPHQMLFGQTCSNVRYVASILSSG